MRTRRWRRRRRRRRQSRPRPPPAPLAALFSLNSIIVMDPNSYRLIEPLFGVLRDPRAFCERTFTDTPRAVKDPVRRWFDRQFMLSRYYLLADSTAADDAGSRRARAYSQRFFFDLGASVYDYGPGGTSQRFFFETYEQRHLSFTRALMWEAGRRAPADIFNVVPDRFFHAYQYFNVPVTVDANSRRDPLRIMEEIVIADTYYVVFKLDIDNEELERPLVERLAASDGLRRRVGEFYWEQHGGTYRRQ